MGKSTKRYDSKRRLLRTGEVERADGYYVYRWTDRMGKRHSITAGSLESLREKENDVLRNKLDGIREDAQNITVNDIYELWCDTKRGLKDNTFQNYKYLWTSFVKADFGRIRIQALKKSDVRKFYNMLVEERGLQISTIDGIHNVLHQVLDIAVEDGYLRVNAADNVMRDLKKANNFGAPHRKALTIPEQRLFLEFLADESTPYHHWEPVFTILINTGMRVGELTGLRWADIDLEAGIINVNHTLVYYNHAENGCYYNIHTPKTDAGKRRIPMLEVVKEAFKKELAYQRSNHIRSAVVVDGYTDFIFINRFGGLHNQSTLNKALRRIIRDCNQAVLDKNPDAQVLLPRFSCHSLRHTFTTRLVESGVNLKVAQDVLGHKDVSTTLNIYTDVTKELAKREFDNLEMKLKENFDSV